MSKLQPVELVRLTRGPKFYTRLPWIVLRVQMLHPFWPSLRYSVVNDIRDSLKGFSYVPDTTG